MAVKIVKMMGGPISFSKRQGVADGGCDIRLGSGRGLRNGSAEGQLGGDGGGEGAAGAVGIFGMDSLGLTMLNLCACLLYTS